MTQAHQRVRKSNNLVQAKFRLTTNEYRILLYCATKIEPMKKDVSTVFRVYGQEYAEMFGISEKNAYKQIREGLDATWDREFYEWLPQGKNKEPGWVRRRFVITQEYNPSEGYGALEMHPDFIQHLIDLREQYTDYAIRNVQYLRSFNAMRIYELLAQYRAIGRRKFQVDWFREVLSLENNYPRWTDLKKHVLTPCLRAITESTDIDVVRSTSGEWFTAHKRGRSVVSFEICFRHKAQQTLDLEETEVVETPVVEPEWKRRGFASPGEFRESRELGEKHGVEFAGARDYFSFRRELTR